MNENQNNEQQQIVPVTNNTPNTPALVFDTIEHFENAQRIAKCLCSANMLPVQYRGAENIGNCMIAMEIANRGRLPIMEVFTNLILVQGRPSWFATYLIGRVNSCGRYSTLRWESEGDNTANWRMRAKCVELLTGEELIGSWVSLQMARDEHWGAKWNTMPEQMLRYRSAAFWVRAYAPDIAMGIKDQYEVEDIVAEEVTTQQNPEEAAAKQEAAANALRSAIGKKKPTTPVKTDPEDITPDPEMPTPIVSVKVETPTTEGNPKTGKDNPYLQKALQNLGLRKEEGEKRGEIDFESSEQ